MVSNAFGFYFTRNVQYLIHYALIFAVPEADGKRGGGAGGEAEVENAAGRRRVLGGGTSAGYGRAIGQKRGAKPRKNRRKYFSVWKMYPFRI
ncbi:hypothetical protein GWI33_003214 [Rhynchophorus ferrugineus]|uniref:Uncharacterized protein n=1 Tax=Rhynchophorus ferrugineus TaxID=354439 RepID=A0A834MP87_RHYFE|nr:hypothetical protein GWI33_003214 [Rhynchophorus ferrugineus]